MAPRLRPALLSFSKGCSVGTLPCVLLWKVSLLSPLALASYLLPAGRPQGPLSSLRRSHFTRRCLGRWPFSTFLRCLFSVEVWGFCPICKVLSDSGFEHSALTCVFTGSASVAFLRGLCLPCASSLFLLCFRAFHKSFLESRAPCRLLPVPQVTFPPTSSCFRFSFLPISVFSF